MSDITPERIAMIVELESVVLPGIGPVEQSRALRELDTPTLVRAIEATYDGGYEAFLTRRLTMGTDTICDRCERPSAVLAITSSGLLCARCERRMDVVNADALRVENWNVYRA